MFGARELGSYWPNSRTLTGMGQHLKEGADRNGRHLSYNSKRMDLANIQVGLERGRKLKKIS